VGAAAKIACRKGVLTAIGAIQTNAATDIQGAAKTCESTQLNYEANKEVSLSTSACPTFSASTLQGTFSVTASNSASITAGAGSIALTCSVGTGSPDLTAIVVGTSLNRMECRNGVLTGLAAG
jgi:hypothetical protein